MNHKANHLINEASPYLKQHAYNPVDWYPWGDEALQRAVAEDKPLLLSIGYASCHWCHVMAEEVFENDEIATVMNQYFICIKVDREERPELDKIYMNFVQSVYGTGGWPLNVFLTPKLLPFFGGTYFPPTDMLGLPSFKTVLLRAHKFYQDKREGLSETGAHLAKQIYALSSFEGTPGMLPKDAAEQILSKLYSFIDLEQGGFGQAAKFPQTMLVSFLMQYASSNPNVAQAVHLTLDNMANKGLYDHIGGGFYRYCVDSGWKIPHFEKMLYDNALIPLIFLEAYQLWDVPRYREVVEETLNFILRKMTHPDGGFFSSINADSEGEEGKCYVWEPGEIARILGDKNGTIFCDYYGITSGGNFESGKSILNISMTIPELAHKHQLSLEEIQTILQTAREKIFQARQNRIPPDLDDKILTAWNGMMVHTFASAYLVLENPQYLRAAENAVDFIERNMERNGH